MLVKIGFYQTYDIMFIDIHFILLNIDLYSFAILIDKANVGLRNLV